MKLTNDDRHVTIFFGFQLLWLVEVDDDCDHEQQKQQLKHNSPAFADRRTGNRLIRATKLRHSTTNIRKVLNAFQIRTTCRPLEKINFHLKNHIFKQFSLNQFVFKFVFFLPICFSISSLLLHSAVEGDLLSRCLRSAK